MSRPEERGPGAWGERDVAMLLVAVRVCGVGETFDLCLRWGRGREGGGAAVLVAVWEIEEAFELRAFVCVWYCG